MFDPGLRPPRLLLQKVFWCLALDYDRFGYYCRGGLGVWSWTTEYGHLGYDFRGVLGVWSWTTTASVIIAEGGWCLVLDYDHFGYCCRGGFGVWSWTTTTSIIIAEGGFGAWSWTTATSVIIAEGVLVFGPGLRPCWSFLQRGIRCVVRDFGHSRYFCRMGWVLAAASRSKMVKYKLAATQYATQYYL